MNVQTLIHKYKPRTIDDFHMDHEFISILRTLIEMGDLNLLFIGNPNSGKTTFLYTIVREYYNIKHDDPIPETNVLFINNLKEQGINYYRNEMKTFCQSHCSIYGKKKLIIIDDMDTINEQSQQVFRNYIDKYKHNVNFISVCTNIQKIIESIQSRLNILRFHNLSTNNMKIILNNIIKNENIKIDEPSIEYILKISGNSIRNVINNIEKIYLIGEPIELDMCKTLCSNISFQQFEDYINSFANNQLVLPIQILYNIHDFGYSVIDILDYFFLFIKITDLLNEMQKYKIIPIICKYTTIFHNIHEDVIELALFTSDLYPIICN
jgi:DNA polymerase III delta prime subunit